MGKSSNAQRATRRKRLSPRTPKPGAPESTLGQLKRAFFSAIRPEGFQAGTVHDEAEGLLAAIEFVLPGAIGSIVVEFPWGQHRQVGTALLDLEAPEPEQVDGKSGLVVAQPGTEHAVAREAQKIEKLKKGPKRG